MGPLAQGNSAIGPGSKLRSKLASTSPSAGSPSSFSLARRDSCRHDTLCDAGGLKAVGWQPLSFVMLRLPCMGRGTWKSVSSKRSYERGLSALGITVSLLSGS